MSVFNNAQNAFVQGDINATQVYGDQVVYSGGRGVTNSQHFAGNQYVQQPGPLRGMSSYYVPFLSL